MRTFLISLVLLTVPVALLADGSNRVASRFLGDGWGDVCCTIDHPRDAGAGDKLLMRQHRGTDTYGFPFYATESILRWHETPARGVRPALPPAQWI